MVSACGKAVQLLRTSARTTGARVSPDSVNQQYTHPHLVHNRHLSTHFSDLIHSTFPHSILPNYPWMNTIFTQYPQYLL